MGGAPLENIIGKEIAQRILEGGPSGALQGEGLKVGAIGLRRLYDKDLPIVAGKVIKKSGAKVERATAGAAARDPAD